MGGKVLPIRERRAIERLLAPTLQIQHVVLDYTPDFLATALHPESPLPNAWTSLVWASHACQDARYLLYLAHHDRLYYSRYKKPPDAFTADAIAVMFFTSFTLNVVAAENHLAIAALLADGGHIKEGWAPVAAKIVKKLSKEFSVFLQPLLVEGTDWQWVRTFRERWFHLDPVRVKELGFQWCVSSERCFCVQDPVNKTLTCGLGGGDAPEVTVDEMLAKGRAAFELFSRQYALMVLHLQERVRSEWQSWGIPSKVLRLKPPRKRPIPWVRTWKKYPGQR
jgi:hypothetical protein